MKWLVLPALVAIGAVPSVVRAQEVVDIGKIVNVEDNSPSLWGMSGMDMIHVKASANGQTPVTRTMVWDARNVEILSRTQAPPLRASDIQHVSMGGRDLIVVRKYLLLEVMPEDARAERMSKSALAHKWAAAVRKVLPLIAPTPSRFGV